MKFLFVILTLFFGQLVTEAQTLSRQVISSFGGAYSSDTLNWSYTMGQTVYTTTDSLSTILTQGFEQPDAKREIMYQEIIPDCDNGQGVSIQVNVVELCGDFSSEIFFDYGPAQELIVGVTPGNHQLEVVCGGINSHLLNFTVEELDIPKCELVFYSGFVPNGVFDNQIWYIENIDLAIYEDNEVAIYDRWGSLVWEGKNYDNQTVVWAGKNTNKEDLPQGTYYYIVKAANTTYKGYIELIR